MIIDDDDHCCHFESICFANFIVSIVDCRSEWLGERLININAMQFFSRTPLSLANSVVLIGLISFFGVLLALFDREGLPKLNYYYLMLEDLL